MNQTTFVLTYPDHESQKITVNIAREKTTRTRNHHPAQQNHGAKAKCRKLRRLNLKH